MVEQRQLGDFVLDRKVGQGGMGEVYLAHQVSLDRRVAVKVLPRSLASQENFIERFQREAKAAANLIHPNVIQIYSIGVEQGTPYFAMEFVEGEDLSDRLKRVKRLSYEDSVDVVSGVANALACAFEKNIVHRDIKPSNIMLDKNDVVKVMDFGLAKATQGSDQLNLTQSGLIMGTPNYMSPEQAKGESLDCRSDIYSLGVVFYELITGRLPFIADTPAALIYKHAYEEPEQPTTVNRDVPPFLAEISTRMMAKDPNQRYQNPKALLLDLNEFRRNVQYYLKGGKRRQPVVTGDTVRTGDHTMPVRSPASEAGMSASSFKDAETMAETRHAEGGRGGGVSTQDLSQAGTAGGRRSPLVWVVIVGVVAAGGWLAWPRIQPMLAGAGAAGSPTGTGAGVSSGIGVVAKGNGVLDLAALGKRLPTGVKVFLQQGADRKELPFADLEVPIDRYVLIFQRRGFRDVTRDVSVTAAGTDPPLLEMDFAFEATAELQRLFTKAESELEQRRYGKAVELLETIDTEAPDFPGLDVLLAEARKRYAELEESFREGQRLITERAWGRAIEVLRKLPDSYENHFQALQLISTAEAKQTTVGNLRNSFDGQFAEGEFKAARLTLEQLEVVLPPGSPDVAARAGRVERAEKLYTDAAGEYENEQLREAKKYLESLLEICPNHQEGRRMLAEVRDKLRAIMGEAEKLAEAIEAAEAALAASDPQRALSAAEDAMRAAPDDPTAKGILERVRLAVARGEIEASFSALDRFFRERKLFNILEAVDPAETQVRAALEKDLERFFAEAIVVAQASHEELELSLVGDAEPPAAQVECVWRLELRFPLAKGAEPPARGEVTRLTVRQRVGMRRSGTGWLFTSFEQLGKANVE
jgi:tetratricopeptide (TPR) repeat protein